ncbi:TetR/AcrR family transcriptional regulator [Streptomyces sp. NPDC059443]|uniref:TetR/AcrR family transcriptional regulator n=1 Tax=unclassified Streptomyces TaxID=2593676 RepID=UPI0036747CD7
MRQSADERRERVLLAAIAEFSAGGYHGTSTEAIARRAGVSQPYVFRLFPGKRALFTAAAVRSFEQTGAAYARAAAGLRGPAALAAMSRARDGLLDDGGVLLMRLQAVTASASLSASASASADDPEFAGLVRRCWSDLWDLVRACSGAAPAEVAAFFAHESLACTKAAMAPAPVV